MKSSPRNLVVQPVTPADLLAFGLPAEQVDALSASINVQIKQSSAEERWSQLTKHVLAPTQPFELHLWLFQSVYFDSEDNASSWFASLPTEKELQGSNVAKLAKTVGADDYADLYQWTINCRADYWNLVVRELGIQFSEDPARTAEDQNDPNAWIPPRLFNIADSCFQGNPDKIAILSRDEFGNDRKVTLRELESLTHRVANGLVEAGIEPGERVGMMLTMSIEAVAAYLGTISAGCVPVSIAESFAAPEISLRMRLANAQAIFTNDVIWRSGKKLPSYTKWKETNIEALAIVIPSQDEPSVEIEDRDTLWCDFLSTTSVFASKMQTASSELNILFSSGTTGDPKAIPWTHSTPIKCAADGRYHQDIRGDSIVAWPTSLGWMMGPWLVFASLLNRATIALFDGAPNSVGFCRFVQDAKVTMLGVIPSLVRAWRNADSIAGLDWSSIEVFSSTGECSNSEDMLYLMSRAGYRPVIEYCGGTEIGGGYIASTVVQPNRPSCFSTPALGMEFVLLDEGMPSEQGEVFLHGPSLGLSQTLLNADHEAVYFEGAPAPEGYTRLRRHGDELVRLPDGYYRAVGRADDAMNLGGIKVSAVEIERRLNELPSVAETAAVAASEGQPSALVIFAVAKASVDVEELRSRMQAAISERLNPLFRISKVILLDSLPRTASNKIMRRFLRDRVSDEKDQ